MPPRTGVRRRIMLCRMAKCFIRLLTATRVFCGHSFFARRPGSVSATGQLRIGTITIHCTFREPSPMTQTLSQQPRRFRERRIGRTPHSGKGTECGWRESLSALTGQIVPKRHSARDSAAGWRGGSRICPLAELKASPNGGASRPIYWHGTPPCSYRRLSCATCWKIRARYTAYTYQRKSLRGVWKRCSTSTGDAGPDGTVA